MLEPPEGGSYPFWHGACAGVCVVDIERSGWMTGFRSFLVTVLLMTGLSACVLGGGGTAIGPIYGPGCVSDVAKHIKGVDWAEARVITVRIRQDEFEPMVISMRQDSPYIFRIENRDDYEHFFMASNFFRSVAIASINTPKKISKASCINGVRIGAMETVELQLVAVRDGRYEYMDKMFPLPSLGSMTGLISVGLPLKYTSSLVETANRRKSASASAFQDIGAISSPMNPFDAVPANPQPSDANPFDAVPSKPQPSYANPFDAVPSKSQPSDANPFDAAEPAKPQPSDANPFETVEPTKPQPSDANPFETVEPAKPQPSDANPFETVEPTKPKPSDANPFETAKPVESPPAASTTTSSLPAGSGSVPDPFDSTKPVLRNVRIPNPFPDMAPSKGGKTGSLAPVIRPEQPESDTLGTETPPTSVIPSISGDNVAVPAPPPPTSGNAPAKRKPDIKAKIRAKIKGFFGSIFGK